MKLAVSTEFFVETLSEILINLLFPLCTVRRDFCMEQLNSDVDGHSELIWPTSSNVSISFAHCFAGRIARKLFKLREGVSNR